MCGELMQMTSDNDEIKPSFGLFAEQKKAGNNPRTR
jgi:hypothetical protein